MPKKKNDNTTSGVSVGNSRGVDAHAYFGSLADSYGDDYKDLSHKKYPANRYRLNLVKKILTDLRPKRILDIGCGTGDPLVEIAKMGFDVSGFDFSLEMVSKARENLAAAGISAEAVFQDDMEIPSHVPAGVYDCMIALGAVYYARDFNQTMQNLTDLLLPRGHFIFSLRNQLFSMFSMNHYTKEFILENLVPYEKLSKGARLILCETLEKKYDEGSVKKIFDNVDTQGVHSVFHNPLTIKSDVLEPLGLRYEDTYYYHFHALPPLFEHLVSEEFHELSAQMEVGTDWRGIFMASSFVVHATKV